VPIVWIGRGFLIKLNLRTEFCALWSLIYQHHALSGFTLDLKSAVEPFEIGQTMFAEVDDDLFKLSDSLEAFNELEKCTDRAILAQRSSERVEIRAKLMFRPANPSQRHTYAIEAVTADISNGGCMVLASRAILPGDIYHVTFHEQLERVGPLLARCMRCRMVQEDAFEVGLRFLQDIPLKDLLR
jgi:hypothetical protein